MRVQDQFKICMVISFFMQAIQNSSCTGLLLCIPKDGLCLCQDCLQADGLSTGGDDIVALLLHLKLARSVGDLVQPLPLSALQVVLEVLPLAALLVEPVSK